MELIDKTSGSGSINEIKPGGSYKRSERSFQPLNDTYIEEGITYGNFTDELLLTHASFTITITSAQFDDCVREFKISVKSPSNKNDKWVTKVVTLPCERINKEFLLLMGLIIFSFLVATSIAGIILQCIKILKPSLRYVPS